MDCSNIQPTHPYIKPLLYEQLLQQSSQCDVTIKVGLWEKRFHWCVLVASPFFETIYRNPFLEKQRGIIELNRWPVSVVDNALLFLYGRKPKNPIANVDKLLDIAEFLLVPELKVVCINPIKRTEVTIDNCMQLLELSSVYGFEMDTCQSFIRGHLPEVLEQEAIINVTTVNDNALGRPNTKVREGGMLNATPESVKMLLKDPTLRYVHVHNWFNFLVRWTQHASERHCRFVELFRMLNVRECDRDFIKNIVAKEPLVMNSTEGLVKTLPTGVDGSNDPVLIFKNDNYKSLTCFNCRTMLWYRVDIYNASDNDLARHFRNTPITSVKNCTSSEIYKTRKTYGAFSVLTHDLSNAHSFVSNVVINATGDGNVSATGDDNVRVHDLQHYSLANDMLVAVCNTFRTKYMTGENSRLVITTIKISILYIGILMGPYTEMHAILTIQNYTISQVCCGENGSIAMLSDDKHSLFIYNEPTGELEAMLLTTHFRMSSLVDNRLAAFRDGFVLHDDNNLVCISIFWGTSLQTKYVVKELSWDTPRRSNMKHIFDGYRWFRITRYPDVHRGAVTSSIEYVGHEDLVWFGSKGSIPWKLLPLSESELAYNACIDDVFAVSLPKGITRCHLDCPHCKLTDQS